MHLAKTFALFGYTIFFPFPSHPVPSQRLYEDISCPFIPVDMARSQAKSNIKNKRRQLPVLKDQGGVLKSPHCVFELTVCREAVSGHQEASSRSQKRTFAGNRKPSQAIHIRKQSYPGNTDTSLASDKQRPYRQESMFFPYPSCHRKLT